MAVLIFNPKTVFEDNKYENSKMTQMAPKAVSSENIKKGELIDYFVFAFIFFSVICIQIGHVEQSMNTKSLNLQWLKILLWERERVEKSISERQLQTAINQ